ncbi:MAG: glycoside hydrolase family 32 protein [Oscillospiraceae bacterium]|nr:glycoside hydrolase family 32 protein [Oscillospiraceae bacterium]
MEQTAQIRLNRHFEPQTGWMNDPNGLIFYGGKYHAFFQYNPYGPVWDRMHWGHAVSTDLVHWEQQNIALYPDEPYEDDGGCFSGSAVQKDGKLYLFYTSVSHQLGQTQSVAVSEDAVHFAKYAGNPVIVKNPLGYPDFRDPKVSNIDGKWYMVVGTGNTQSGKVLLFTSEDLLTWTYVSVLFEGEDYAHCIECPDFFKMEDRYVLMFSSIGKTERSTVFAVGDFVDGKLVNYSISQPEWGPDFYAPQTMLAPDGRRILLGWFYHWGKQAPAGCSFAGALSAARELRIRDGKVLSYPVSEMLPYLKKDSAYVVRERDSLTLSDCCGNKVRREIAPDAEVDILEDTKTVEVFVNRGEQVFSWWLV